MLGSLSFQPSADSPLTASRERTLVHDGLTVWLTGLSGSGKSTIGELVCEQLKAHGYRAEFLDSELCRQYLGKDLKFSKEDRDENIRRISFIASLLTRNQVITVVAAISPYRDAREQARRDIGEFLEVYVNAPLDVCEQRDTKGLYGKARRGELPGLTGLDDPYEPPMHPVVECRTDEESPADSARKVWEAIERRLSARGIR